MAATSKGEIDVGSGHYYAGSHLLLPISEAANFPIDQVNFIVCQLISLALAIPFRIYLPPSPSNTTRRHAFELVIGFLMATFCFGYTVIHLIFISLLSYIVIFTELSPFIPAKSHVIVFIFSMTYLCLNHIYRQIYDYGSWTLDVTGPMMLMVLKTTGLAFSHNDGRQPQSQLSPDQLDQLVLAKPTLLEYFSYMFYFHGMMCGPPCTYADFKRFIEGTNYSVKRPIKKKEFTSEKPSPLLPALSKLAYAVICAILMLTVAARFDPMTVVDDNWIASSSVLERLVGAMVYLGLIRTRYYFAYYLSESVNNLAGLGFNGWDGNGNAKWDIISNVDITKVELSLSLRETVEAWNKTSTIWLRRTIYDRLPPPYNLPATYAVSAIWHGFYPGYYFTFGSAALFIAASRKVRRNVRSLFQSSLHSARFYDGLTFLTTRLVTPYCFGPFIILSARKSWQFYNSMYFSFHIGALLLIIFMPQGNSAVMGKNTSNHKSTKEK